MVLQTVFGFYKLNWIFYYIQCIFLRTLCSYTSCCNYLYQRNNNKQNYQNFLAGDINKSHPTRRTNYHKHLKILYCKLFLAYFQNLCLRIQNYRFKSGDMLCYQEMSRVDIFLYYLHSYFFLVALDVVKWKRR